jgi:hypothetical protein
VNIYQAGLEIQIEIHAGSAEEAAERRGRLPETLTRLLSESPALHAMGVTHFRVDLLDAFREKTIGESPAAELRRSDAMMTPTVVPDAGDRHGSALGVDDSLPDDTPAHYTDNSATSASSASAGGAGAAGAP